MLVTFACRSREANTRVEVAGPVAPTTPSTPLDNRDDTRVLTLPAGIARLEILQPIFGAPANETSLYAPVPGMRQVPATAKLSALAYDLSPALIAWANAEQVTLQLDCSRPLPSRDVHHARCSFDQLAGEEEASLDHIAKLAELRTLELPDVWHAEQWQSISRLKRLQAISTEQSIDDSIAILLSQIKSLHTLEIIDPGELTATGVRALAALPALTSLTVGRMDVTDEIAAALADLQKLETLHVGRASALTEAGVKQLLRLKRLRVLSLGDAALPTDAWLTDINSLPMLTSFELWRQHLTGAGLHALANHPALEQLAIRDAYWIAVPWLPSELPFKNLRELLIALPAVRMDVGRNSRAPFLKCDSQETAGLSRLLFGQVRLAAWAMPRISAASKLQRLTLNVCDVSVSDIAPLQRLPRLRALTLEVGDHISPAALAKVGALPTLQALHLSHGALDPASMLAWSALSQLTSLSLDRINETHLHAISQLQGLRYLKISLETFTMRAAQHIGALAQLTSLDLYVDDQSIDGHKFAPLQKLTKLEQFLRDDPLDAPAVRHLAGVGSLSELDLSNSQITPQLAKALQQFPKLAFVFLPDQAFSNDAIAALAANTTLRGFMIGGSVDSATVASLMAMPSLRFVIVSQDLYAELGDYCKPSHRDTPAAETTRSARRPPPRVVCLTY